LEQLQAVVSATIFRNEENGYSVLTVRADKQPLTVVGVLPALYSGEQVVFTGEWINHPSYGRQFRASGFEIRTPESLQGLQRYLASGAIHGIGDATAALIVAHFGEETLSVLTDHPERLTEIKGIGKIRAAEIAESFREGQEERLTMIFLQTCGISGVLAERILKQYGADAPEAIREDPFQLVDDIGIGIHYELACPRSFGEQAVFCNGLEYGKIISHTRIIVVITECTCCMNDTCTILGSNVISTSYEESLFLCFNKGHHLLVFDEFEVLTCHFFKNFVLTAENLICKSLANVVNGFILLDLYVSNVGMNCECCV